MSPTVLACLDELQKIGSAKQASGGRLGAAGELLGLGALAAPQIDKMVAKRKARRAGALDAHGEISEHDLDKFRRIKGKHDAAIDVAGLGILAAPYAKTMLTGK